MVPSGDGVRRLVHQRLEARPGRGRRRRARGSGGRRAGPSRSRDRSGSVIAALRSLREARRSRAGPSAVQITRAATGCRLGRIVRGPGRARPPPRPRRRSLLPGWPSRGSSRWPPRSSTTPASHGSRPCRWTGCPQLAAWGVGFSTAFDYFRFDDWVAAPASGEGPVGDQRIVPDLDRLVVLAGPAGLGLGAGRALRPGRQGAPAATAGCCCAVWSMTWPAVGLEVQVGLRDRVGRSRRATATTSPRPPPDLPTAWPGWSRSPTTAATCSRRWRPQGVVVEQFHPEYAAGQLELSVAAASPRSTPPTPRSWCAPPSARSARGTASARRSPRRSTPGASATAATSTSASGATGDNLMAGGRAAPSGSPTTAWRFAAGVLDRLPALLALGAPGVASYLRLVPQHWAGAYACWGLENREAALRMVTGSTGSERLGGQPRGQVLRPARQPLPAARRAAGRRDRRSGRRRHACPDPVDVDPAALGAQGLADRGHRPAPHDTARGASTRSSPTTYCAPPSASSWSTPSPRSASPRSSSSPAPRPRTSPTPPVGPTDAFGG